MASRGWSLVDLLQAQQEASAESAGLLSDGCRLQHAVHEAACRGLPCSRVVDVKLDHVLSELLD